MNNGKYKKWLEVDNLVKVEGWARTGLSDAQISKNMGISTVTFYDWKKKYPMFSNAVKKGKEVVDFEVENALLKRAMGYTYEEVTTEIYTADDGEIKEKHVKKVKKAVAPDTGAAIFWLKNRMPDRWRDKIESPMAFGSEVVIIDDI